MAFLSLGLQERKTRQVMEHLLQYNPMIMGDGLRQVVQVVDEMAEEPGAEQPNIELGTLSSGLSVTLCAIT
jgi:hypothetical protein